MNNDDMHDWKYEVANGDTLLGFVEWKEHRREAERNDEREALRREARQEAMLDAGPILAEQRRLKGET